MRITKYSSVAACLFCLGGAVPCGQSFIYVSGWGNEGIRGITTLKLAGSSLSVVFNTDECGFTPTWLQPANNILYCTNEGWSESSTLTSFAVNSDGSLSKLHQVLTQLGPVHSVVYGGGSRLAVPYYGSSGLNLFDIADPNVGPRLLQNFTFVQPGDIPKLEGNEQQRVPRPHQALLDPTGEFIVLPDLGSDRLRVLRVDKQALQVTDTGKDLVFKRGSGPRHAVFFKSGTNTFLYIITELSNRLLGYKVSYENDKTLGFTSIQDLSTHGGQEALPDHYKGSEILISPDNKFLTVSSRNESTLQFTLANGTTIPSDPLISFSIDPNTGVLTHVQTASAGGVFPRHFSFNKDGSLVVSALQNDGRVVVFQRDVKTGKIGNKVAEIDLPGMSPAFAMFKQ